MDTSGTNFNPKNVTKPTPDFTNEESSAILKYGAQNMCVLQDNPSMPCITYSVLPCRFKADETALNKKNIAEMDLDDILNKAEEHETVRRQTLAQHRLAARVSYINWLS